MNCTPPVVENGEYLECYEDQPAGLETDIAIFHPEDVATWPAFSTTAAGEVTENMAALRADAAIAMTASKFPTKLIGIMEKGSLQIKKAGRNTWTNELKIWIQNTELNRAVIYALSKKRFALAVTETEGEHPLLLGQSDGVNTQYLCKIADDGVLGEFGMEFASDKYVEVTFMAKPKHAVVYPFAIAYS